MNRIDRLFGILTFLQSRKYVSAEKIADKFGISVRTVYRDIKALCEQGIPISFEQHKGYFVVQGYFLPPVSFSNEEANALLLIEALVSGFADRSIQNHYATALNKVKAVLRHTQKEKLELLHPNIMLQVPKRIMNDLDYLSVLQEAISSKHILAIEYKNNKEEISNRRLEPIGLIFYAFSWHLIAWCHLRSEYRDFKVASIIRVKNTQDPFLRPGHISLNEYTKMLPVDY
ncbi:helix-turn-helix transcriptional regulator [Taibaiella chishuiensis]|uniref:HTH domain-containing protein n=1 Tax=Taibaiella chishuiensis TaxID=1434707 RepID=A0A2P8CVA7_9BACT|nr:YafY family protein [Taibaiella chishuiensis]PSK88887.1 HTH domain-containing protein [Taibaiella chishuiensis]